MAENTKMEVEGNANETLPEEEREENMDEGAEEEDESSDSDESDGSDAVIDPKIQQLELQVSCCFCTCFVRLTSCC